MSVVAIRRRVRALGLAVCILALAPVLHAVPAIKSASLRFGASPRLPVAEWAYLQYCLENPDADPVTVRLSLRSVEHGRGVFEKAVQLGPRTRVRGRELVTVDSSNSYILSLFLGDERIERTDIPVNSADMPAAATLMVLNDDPEFAGTGDLAKAGVLRESISLTNVSAHSAPHHWAAYGHTRVVVIANPRYRDLSAAQFDSLVTYVQRGGTILFASPAGTLAAAATPWGSLLPVVPLRVRLTEALPELDAWGAAWWEAQPPTMASVRRPLQDRDGFALLESSELGEGVTTLRAGALPLVRWRRCGLGRVGIVAVDPCHRRLRDSGALVPLWNHVLTFAQPVAALRNLENSLVLPSVLAHLTGFRIPSASAIGLLLLGYVGGLTALLLGGFLSRRHVVSWIVAAGGGLVLTALIFTWAFRQNAGRPSASAAILDVSMSGGERTTADSIVSLFAKKDMRPAIGATDSESLIRPLPSAARGKRREPLDAPLIMFRQAERSTLSGITVQAFKPREFAAQDERPPLPLSVATLVLTDGPPAIRDSVLPTALASRHAQAFLLAAGDLLPIRRDGAHLGSLAGTARLLGTDPFLQDLGRYLINGAFPRPAIVVLQPWEESSAQLALDLPGFVQAGYAVHLLPVAWECAPGQVRLPPEFIRLEPGGLSARVLLNDELHMGQILRSAHSLYTFDLALPAVLADLRVTEVTVDLDFSNAGGNVQIEPRLVRTPLQLGVFSNDGAEEERQWPGALAAAAADAGSVFRFAGPGVAPLNEPVYGRLRLLLRASQKTMLGGGVDAERSNRWRLNRLRVALTGALPEAEPARKF